MFILACAGSFVGCGGESAPPIATSSGNAGRPGDGGRGGRGGRGGSSGGGDSGEGGEGGTGGNAGMGEAGMAGGEPIEVPDSPANPWIAFSQNNSSSFGQLMFVKADAAELPIEYGGTDSVSESDPAWSPDGTRLAFAAMASDYTKTLHVLDFDAGTDVVLDTGLLNLTRPRWTPDGSALIVSGRLEVGGKDALFRIDATEGGSQPLTASVSGDGGHDVALDGNVYFVRKLDESTFDVFSVPVTGSPSTMPTRVTTDARVLGGVAVHPDASRLVFARSSGTASSTLIEHTIAGNSDRTIGEGGDEQAAYFSGGDKLVLNREYNASGEIAVTDASGGEATRCTDNMAIDGNPSASPVESDDIDVAQFE